MAESPAESNPPPAAATPPDHVLYQIVAQRRCAYDSMLWSTPAISLAGLTFFFTIALDPETAYWPRLLASLLALCFAIASSHLLCKHRYGEKNDSTWLERYERDRFSGEPVHAQHGTALRAPRSRLNPKRWSAYYLWQSLLLLFAVAALLIVVMASKCPKWFKQLDSHPLHVCPKGE